MVVPVVHAGRTIDRLRLRLEGIDPAWCRVEPAQVTLRPGESSEARLSFRVPHGAPAGRHAYRLVAVSASGGERTVHESAIHVGEMTDLHLEVVPYRQRARGAASFRVYLRNAGNGDQLVRLFAGESGATLRFTLEPEDVALAPSEERVAWVHVRPTNVSPLGPPRSYVFWVG